jgi:peroxiredoxin Q/BCP
MKKSMKFGAKAPAFALKDHAGRMVRLADFRGEWVVLYFYPKDDTPDCTTEACEFTEGIHSFGRLRAKVIGISPDSPESHAAFAEKFHLKHVLLSDLDHKVIEAYGAWGEKSLYGRKTTAVVRSTWLVSPDGKLAFHWPEVKAEGHADEVREKLAELSDLMGRERKAA